MNQTSTGKKYHSLVRKVMALFVAGALGVALLIIVGVVLNLYSLLMSDIRQRLGAFCRFASISLEPDACSRLVSALPRISQEGGREALSTSADYLSVSARLADLRSADPDFIRYAYLFTRGPDEGSVFYIADADALAIGDEASLYGEEDDLSAYPAMEAALNGLKLELEKSLTYDQTEGLWSMSAYAPVVAPGGAYVGMVGLDVSGERFTQSLRQVLTSSALLFGLGLIILVVISLIMFQSLSRPITTMLRSMQDLSTG